MNGCQAQFRSEDFQRVWIAIAVETRRVVVDQFDSISELSQLGKHRSPGGSAAAVECGGGCHIDDPFALERYAGGIEQVNFGRKRGCQLAIDRLNDAENEVLTYASRFDLAYGASHGLALAALRASGHRSDKRYLVFQCLVHTTELGKTHIRLFATCHERRNLAEY